MSSYTVRQFTLKQPDSIIPGWLGVESCSRIGRHAESVSGERCSSRRGEACPIWTVWCPLVPRAGWSSAWRTLCSALSSASSPWSWPRSSATVALPSAVPWRVCARAWSSPPWHPPPSPHLSTGRGYSRKASARSSPTSWRSFCGTSHSPQHRLQQSQWTLPLHLWHESHFRDSSYWKCRFSTWWDFWKRHKVGSKKEERRKKNHHLNSHFVTMQLVLTWQCNNSNCWRSSLKLSDVSKTGTCLLALLPLDFKCPGLGISTVFSEHFSSPFPLSQYDLSETTTMSPHVDSQRHMYNSSAAW